MEKTNSNPKSPLLEKRYGVDATPEEEITPVEGTGSVRKTDGEELPVRPVSVHNIGKEFSTSQRDRPKSNCDQAAGLFFVALAVVSVAFAILFAMGVFGPNQYFAAGFMGIVAIPFAGVGAITLWPSRSTVQELGNPALQRAYDQQENNPFFDSNAVGDGREKEPEIEEPLVLQRERRRDNLSSKPLDNERKEDEIKSIQGPGKVSSLLNTMTKRLFGNGSSSDRED